MWHWMKNKLRNHGCCFKIRKKKQTYFSEGMNLLTCTESHFWVSVSQLYVFMDENKRKGALPDLFRS